MKKQSDSSRLTRDDWLDAAFDAVVEGGFSNVRVLSLATSLGVTRGSFYWHFEHHANLIAALITRWRDREVALDQALSSGLTDNAQSDLERLLEAALAYGGADLENMRFELALRGVGRRDTSVAQLLAEVDASRMALFRSAFLRMTADADQATDLAALFYLSVVGSHQALSRPATPDRFKDQLRSLIERYLIHPYAQKKSREPG